MLRTKLAAAFLAVSATIASAQTSNYFMTANDQGINWITQGGAVLTSFNQAHPESRGESAIAVLNTIRTQGNGANHGIGSEYTLAGIATGATYGYGGAGSTCFWDGTTDGTHNYSVDFCNGGVWRFGLDWQNAEFMFAATGSNLGITYDPFHDALWLSSFEGGQLSEYSLTGTLLGGFATAAGEEDAALAMDYADGTLWMNVSQSKEGDFVQYSVDGTLLQSVHYNGMEDQNTLGGEFAFPAPVTATPEPATMGLLAAGFAGLGAFARRRRKS